MLEDVGWDEGPPVVMLATADEPAPPRRHDRRALWLAVSASLLVGALLGAYVQDWRADRSAEAADRSEVFLVVSNVVLDWSGGSADAVAVTLVNGGSHELVVESLSSPGGAMEAYPGQLPLRLPVRDAGRVYMTFGEVCVRDMQPGIVLDAAVRTVDGGLAQRSLDYVGDGIEARFVADSVRDECRELTGRTG